MRLGFHIGNVAITIIDTSFEETPAPEDIADAYMAASSDDIRQVLERVMAEHHGLVRDKNGTWVPKEDME